MTDFYKLAAARLDKDRYQKLQDMAENDLRSLSDEIRWLIDGEWNRRERTLIDAKTPYVLEPAND